MPPPVVALDDTPNVSLDLRVYRDDDPGITDLVSNTHFQRD
jgi:hypothetical protein